jgi:hypothetical protein
MMYLNKTVYILTASILLLACKKENQTNGELIFRTGKNEYGIIMKDRNASKKKGLRSCQDCHGRTGGNFFNRKESIKYSDLIDPKLREVPYTDSLLIRFLDQELKSDGSPAETGIVWNMSNKDKRDLIEFLKTL